MDAAQQHETPAPLKCCVCFEEREDRRISILQHPGSPELPYCNDRPVCIAMVKTKQLVAAARSAGPLPETLNRFGVGVAGDDIVILDFGVRMPKRDAMNLSVWIKVLLMDDAEYARTEEAIRNT